MKLLMLFLVWFPLYAISAEISITMDDPGTDIGMSKKILKVLKDENLKAILFVCGKRVDNPEGKKLVSLWDKDDHIIANHTYSHEYYHSDKFDASFLKADIAKNELLLKPFSHFKKFFRYPMLKEGNTEAKRDQVRSFLKENNYRLGHVTVDTSDWYVSERFEKKIKANPKMDVKAFRNYYLEHIWDRATYYQELSKRVLGRDVKHTLLLHHNLLNAYFLKDLIAMFKKKGWKFIDADKAYDDPVFDETPKILPAGESLIWGLAKEKGKFESLLRYPGEDSVYQKPDMDILGL